MKYQVCSQQIKVIECTTEIIKKLQALETKNYKLEIYNDHDQNVFNDIISKFKNSLNQFKDYLLKTNPSQNNDFTSFKKLMYNPSSIDLDKLKIALNNTQKIQDASNDLNTLEQLLMTLNNFDQQQFEIQNFQEMNENQIHFACQIPIDSNQCNFTYPKDVYCYFLNIVKWFCGINLANYFLTFASNDGEYHYEYDDDQGYVICAGNNEQSN